MAQRMTFTGVTLLLLLFSYQPAGAGFSGKHENGQRAHATKKMVYVCACLGNKSCSCMTEAKTEGPCACGTAGGPPLKAVPADSEWAKEDREALAN